MPTHSKPVHQPALSQPTTELFSNANHPVINGGSFSVYSTTTYLSKTDGFLILQENVASAAFHSSMQRVDPPRCHPHTREAILDEIFDWIMGNVPRETCIAWLNGAAGAGKSAICQSIAERCIRHRVPVASFFFFRTDGSRNKIDPLVATLAYQILKIFPETKSHIIDAIELDPLIFEQTLEAQIDVLVVRPLLQVSNLTQQKLLLIIDGVDECDGEKIQTGLIRTIAKLLCAKNLPLMVLFGSRRENQILMAFDSRDMNGLLKQLPLDDNYQPEKDILHFLNDSFDEIRQTHPFRRSLRSDWPSTDHIQEIVQKSSGQFIYASVVMHFLFDPSANPAIRLEIIRGLRPLGRLTPFAQLDALYRHIFSQVDDIMKTLEFLAYVIYARWNILRPVMYFFNFGVGEIQTTLASLASVLHYDLDQNLITFRHASLPDFLRDNGRSKEYCINSLVTPLCIRWLKTVECGRFINLSEYDQNVDIQELLEHAEITDELYANLILYTPSKHRTAYIHFKFPTNFLTAIRNMNFGDDGKAYANMLNNIVRYIKLEFPEKIEYLARSHNVSQLLAQLTFEENEGIHHGVQTLRLERRTSGIKIKIKTWLRKWDRSRANVV